MSANEEWAGLNRHPNIPTVIEGFEYPKPVQSLIKKMDSAYEIWAEADTALAEAEYVVSEAKALDAKLFAESILEGLEDPGEVHTPAALRKLKGAEILANARRTDVNKIGRELEEVMREHAREITHTAIEHAREAVMVWQEAVLEASRIVADASAARYQGLVGLREVSSYTRGVYTFDGNFPISGSLSVPETYEKRVLQICEELEKLMDRNVLFASPEAESDIKTHENSENSELETTA